MTDEPVHEPQGNPEVRTKLQELAELLREADHLDPEAQEELADLVTELGQALESSGLDPSKSAHLAESTEHMVRALHQQHSGLLAAARKRLQRAAAQAQAEAPVATGIVQRLIDVLSDLGI